MANTKVCDDEKSLTKQLKSLLSEQRRLERKIAAIVKKLVAHFTEEHRQSMAQLGGTIPVQVVSETVIPEFVRKKIAQSGKEPRFVIRDHYHKSFCQVRVGEEVFSASYDNLLRPGELLPAARVRQLKKDLERRLP
jgi:hypothetical protein